MFSLKHFKYYFTIKKSSQNLKCWKCCINVNKDSDWLTPKTQPEYLRVKTLDSNEFYSWTAFCGPIQEFWDVASQSIGLTVCSDNSKHPAPYVIWSFSLWYAQHQSWQVSLQQLLLCTPASRLDLTLPSSPIKSEAPTEQCVKSVWRTTIPRKSLDVASKQPRADFPTYMWKPLTCELLFIRAPSRRLIPNVPAPVLNCHCIQ